MLDVAAQVETILPFALGDGRADRRIDGRRGRVPGGTAWGRLPHPSRTGQRRSTPPSSVFRVRKRCFWRTAISPAFAVETVSRCCSRCPLLEWVTASWAACSMGSGRLSTISRRQLGRIAFRCTASQRLLSAGRGSTPPDHGRARHRRAADLRQGSAAGNFRRSGVGKSTLLGQMAKASSADVNVIVLVGERGREVPPNFSSGILGPEGLARSVVVVATSDEPALVRLNAAFLGSAIAEYFRDSRRNVLLMMDSVTRFALAQREIGLAAGEPPATRGYPPSVFALLPKLLKRQRPHRARQHYRPLQRACRSRRRERADFGHRPRHAGRPYHALPQARSSAHWPAVDPLSSISRSMNDIVSPEHRAAAESVKQLLAAYQQSEDLITIGAYQMGIEPPGRPGDQTPRPNRCVLASILD